MMRQVLDCYEGDRRYGLPKGMSVRKGLSAMLKEFGVSNALSIQVTNSPDVLETSDL